MVYEGQDVINMFVVINKDGQPAAICPTMRDAAAFARCLGFDAPLDAMKSLPVVEFAKAGDGNGRG